MNFSGLIANHRVPDIVLGSSDVAPRPSDAAAPARRLALARRTPLLDQRIANSEFFRGCSSSSAHERPRPISLLGVVVCHGIGDATKQLNRLFHQLAVLRPFRIAMAKTMRGRIWGSKKSRSAIVKQLRRNAMLLVIGMGAAGRRRDRGGGGGCRVLVLERAFGRRRLDCSAAASSIWAAAPRADAERIEDTLRICTNILGDETGGRPGQGPRLCQGQRRAFDGRGQIKCRFDNG